MGSAVVYKDEDTFDDGTRYEMVATEVPKSDEYPEGVKYRFQYMAEDGRTLLRFDNFPDHPNVGRHHYHTPAGVDDDNRVHRPQRSRSEVLQRDGRLP